MPGADVPLVGTNLAPDPSPDDAGCGADPETNALPWTCGSLLHATARASATETVMSLFMILLCSSRVQGYCQPKMPKARPLCFPPDGNFFLLDSKLWLPCPRPTCRLRRPCWANASSSSRTTRTRASALPSS